jgi:hypothetical protein
MLGAGTFISPLMRLIVTAGILAAVYFFIVKPILDTTNDTINRAFDATQQPLRQAERLARQNGANNFKVPNDVSTSNAEKLLHCVQRVEPDTSKMQACAARFGP